MFLRPEGGISIPILICIFSDRKEELKAMLRFTTFVNSTSTIQCKLTDFLNFLLQGNKDASFLKKWNIYIWSQNIFYLAENVPRIASTFVFAFSISRPITVSFLSFYSLGYTNESQGYHVSIIDAEVVK